MRISEQFAGNYFKAADLPQPRVLTIQAVELAALPEGETKPAVQFVGEQQQLMLNKTNAFVLAEMFGDDSDAWKGRPVELYATTTTFSGRTVPCIRVRPPQPSQPVLQPAPQPAPVPATGAAPQPPQHVELQQSPQPPMQAPPADYPVDA